MATTGMGYKTVKEALGAAFSELSKSFNIINNIYFDDPENEKKQKEIQTLCRTAGDLISKIQNSAEVKNE